MGVETRGRDKEWESERGREREGRGLMGKEGTDGQLPVLGWVRDNIALMVVVGLLSVLPFVIAILDGQSIAGLLANESGNAKFIQGLMIEVFILAVFAISYDLVLGITGLLSLGHAMFFAVGAYLTGIMLKSFGWSLLPTVGLVIVAGVLQALLFSVVLLLRSGCVFTLSRWLLLCWSICCTGALWTRLRGGCALLSARTKAGPGCWAIILFTLSWRL